MKDRKIYRLLLNFAIELIVYGVLVLIYSLGVLQFLASPLRQLFRSNLTVYAFVALGLIVAQGALLDIATTFLLDQLSLERLE